TLAEVGFGQINIVDLFQMRQYVLHTIKYGSELVRPVAEHLGSYIYQVKAHVGDVYYLGLLITPYSDVNLTAYQQFVDLTCKYYAGSYRRSLAQKTSGTVDIAADYEGADQTARDMLTLQHHLLFERREMRGGVETIRKPVRMFAVVLSDIEIMPSYCQCTMDGCKRESSVTELRQGKCPHCGSEVRYVPPNPIIRRVAFVVPKCMLRVEHPDYQRPMDLVSIVQLGLIPDAVLTAINGINREIFSNIVYVPEHAIYEFRDCDDLFETRSVWRRDNNHLYVATSMGDSLDLFTESIPSMEARTLLRDLTEGIEKGLDFEQILPKTIVRDWLRSEWYSIEDLGEREELQTYAGVLKLSPEEVNLLCPAPVIPEVTDSVETETGERSRGRLRRLLARDREEGGA
ncbi:MAG: hypothetical protein QXQ81_00360, partial [Candidatus Thorarchaeota archaeon]